MLYWTRRLVQASGAPYYLVTAAGSTGTVYTVYKDIGSDDICVTKQAGPLYESSWEKTFAGTGNIPTGAVVTPSGGVVIILSVGSGYNHVVIDATGALEYQRGYSSANNIAATQIVGGSSGTYHVGGYYDGSAYVAKFNADHSAAWQKTYDGVGSYSETAVAVDASGNVYIAVFSGSWLHIVKWNSSGTLQWKNYYPCGYGADPRLYADASNVLISTNVGSDSYLINVHPSDGTIALQKRYTGFSSGIKGLASDGANVFLFGATQPGSYALPTISSLDIVTGAVNWSNRFIAASTSLAPSGQLSYTSGALVCGFVDQSTGDTYTVAVKTDGTGTGAVDLLSYASTTAIVANDTSFIPAPTASTDTITTMSASSAATSRTLSSATPVETVTYMGPAPITGTMHGTLPVRSSSFSGIVGVRGSFAMTLPHLSFYVVKPILGYMTQYLPAIGSAFAGWPGISASMGATFPARTSAFVGGQGIAVTMTGTLPPLTAKFATPGGRFNSPLPLARGDFLGVVGFGGHLAATLPARNGSFTAYIGATGVLTGTTPSMAAAFKGGVFRIGAVLPAVTGAFTGSAATAATMDCALPSCTAAFTGSAAFAGQFALAIPALASAFTGVIGARGVLASSLRARTSTFTGSAGLSAALVGNLPASTGALAGYSAISAALAGMLPRRTGSFARQHIRQLVLAHVTNTLTAAVSLFENYPFNSFTCVGSRFLATSADGLFLLDSADTDWTATGTAPIDAVLRTGQLDFGSAMQKRISDFYIAMRSDGDVTLRVATDDLPDYEYLLKTFDTATLKQRRSLIGKGARGRYWQFELANNDGADFQFDAFNIGVVETVRRI